MSTTPDVHERIDGRTARAVRTREAIVEACLDLIDEGDLRPTGPRIAERAGVSVRSIFQHFDDLDALFAAVGDKVTLRISGLVAHIPDDLPTPERVERFVAQRAQVLEALSPVLRAALVHAATSTVIRGQFEAGHDFLRSQVLAVFGPELAAAPDPNALEQALVVALSWTSWDLLRRVQGQSRAEAEAVLRWMVGAALVRSGADGG